MVPNTQTMISQAPKRAAGADYDAHAKKCCMTGDLSKAQADSYARISAAYKNVIYMEDALEDAKQELHDALEADSRL